MNFISKCISSPKRIFVFFLVSVYIAMVTYALPPYGILPSMVISLMTPLSIFLIAYPTYYILLPRFTNEFTDGRNNYKKIFKYYLPLSLLLIGVAIAFVWACLTILFGVFDLPKGDFPERYSQIRFLNPSLFTLTYIFTNIFYIHNRHHDYMNKVMNEKKDLEMKMLKSQINTHFLHNALNNIYSMIYFGDKEDAANYVMKLSQMLRYVLDDCEADHVSITKEVAYIKNYIDFQKGRFEAEKNVIFQFDLESNHDIRIPPMIFQPLVENCFKHCPLQNEDSFIHIAIIVGKEQIKFTSENTLLSTKQPSDRSGNGIGIENLKSRLSIHFKDRYSLTVLEKNNSYRTELIINL